MDPDDPATQQLIASMMESDVNEATAGRPSNQQQYENHMYGPGGQLYDDQGQPIKQDERRYEMGMDGRIVQVTPSAGFDINRPDPRQDNLRPVRPTTNPAYGGFNQKQNIYQPGPSMVGNDFEPQQPNPFVTQEQNPFQPGPSTVGGGFGSPYQPITPGNPFIVPVVPNFGGTFQPGGGNYVPGPPLPETGFNPLIPPNSAPNPFSIPLPSPGAVVPPAGQPQEEQRPIIGFSQLNHFVIAGKLILISCLRVGRTAAARTACVGFMRILARFPLSFIGNLKYIC